MDHLSDTPPNEIDPYGTLDIPVTASSAEVKTAYKKLALRHHPGIAILRLNWLESSHLLL